MRILVIRFVASLVLIVAAVVIPLSVGGWTWWLALACVIAALVIRPIHRPKPKKGHERSYAALELVAFAILLASGLWLVLVAADEGWYDLAARAGRPAPMILAGLVVALIATRDFILVLIEPQRRRTRKAATPRATRITNS
jgi:hypothetical protein